MSEESGGEKKIAVTMTIANLLRDGITINTDEDVTVTVMDDSGTMSE